MKDLKTYINESFWDLKISLDAAIGILVPVFFVCALIRAEGVGVNELIKPIYHDIKDHIKDLRNDMIIKRAIKKLYNDSEFMETYRKYEDILKGSYGCGNEHIADELQAKMKNVLNDTEIEHISNILDSFIRKHNDTYYKGYVKYSNRADIQD